MSQNVFQKPDIDESQLPISLDTKLFGLKKTSNKLWGVWEDKATKEISYV